MQHQDIDGRFDPAEREQLERGDVPYFFRAAAGGPLLCMVPVSEPPAATEVEVHSDEEPWWPPQPTAVDGDALTLTRLGVALRDAVEHVFDGVDELDMHDARHGVRLQLQAPREGQVAFDWPERDRRITYQWTPNAVRVRIDELSADVVVPPALGPGGAIRRRLLRLDRVDAVLREQWTASGFADAALEEKLCTLTDAGLTWLAAVIEEHGWPGRRLVGAAAAGAASRLVQHSEGHLSFRKRCLELVREAADARDLPYRDVAYLTDTLRLAEGLPQVYGSKFERVGDTLEPCPIEDPEGVDVRRAALGMEPLEEYARRIRARFPLDRSLAEAGPSV